MFKKYIELKIQLDIYFAFNSKDKKLPKNWEFALIG